MMIKNATILVVLAGGLLLGGCSSSSSSSSADAGPATDSDVNSAPLASEVPTTLQATTTIPVQPGPTAPVPTEPVGSEPLLTVPTSRISAQLEDGVLDAIALGDGDTPITSGSWPRFTPDTSWTWQLLGDTKTSYEVDVYVLDMFQQLEGNVIETLHAQNKQVICYFSAGTYEPWRPDANLFANVPMGTEHYAYASEIWLDVTSPETAKVMANRMDMAVALGCDGVELDNVDGFVAETGLNITYQQELDYQRLLANEAHKRNLAVALKNAVEMIPDVVEYFDLAINEVCLVWNECGTYQAIIDTGKPVFHVEYDQAYVDDLAARATMCAQSAELNMRTLVLPKSLDGSFRISCDD